MGANTPPSTDNGLDRWQSRLRLVAMVILALFAFGGARKGHGEVGANTPPSTDNGLDRWQSRLRLVVRPILLFVSLLLIFSMVDTKWNETLVLTDQLLPEHIMKLVTDNTKEDTLSSLQKEVVLQTLKKEYSEIEATSKHTAELFYNKFLIVGGLFGILTLLFKESFTHIAERDQQQPVETLIDSHFLKLCEADFVWALFAIAVIVCMSIDISDRTKISIANGAGAWIARYVEAPILNVTSDMSTKECINNWTSCTKCDFKTSGPDQKCDGTILNTCKKCDPNKDGPRNGWESFLRLAHDDKEGWLKDTVSGAHHDQWGHLLFAIQYHYLTIVLYSIYVGLLYVAFTYEKAENQDHKLKCRIAIALLSIVQISLLAFTIITRESSEILKIKVIPSFLFNWGADWWVTGNSWEAVLYAFILGVSPTVLLGPLLCRLWHGADISFRRPAQSS